MQELERTIDDLPRDKGVRLLKTCEVMERVGYSRIAIYKLVQRGKFPAPIKLNPTTSRWVESEVEEWITQRIETRDNTINKGA